MTLLRLKIEYWSIQVNIWRNGLLCQSFICRFFVMFIENVKHQVWIQMLLSKPLTLWTKLLRTLFVNNPLQLLLHHNHCRMHYSNFQWINLVQGTASKAYHLWKILGTNDVELKYSNIWVVLHIPGSAVILSNYTSYSKAAPEINLKLILLKN